MLPALLGQEYTTPHVFDGASRYSTVLPDRGHSRPLPFELQTALGREASNLSATLRHRPSPALHDRIGLRSVHEVTVGLLALALWAILSLTSGSISPCRKTSDPVTGLAWMDRHRRQFMGNLPLARLPGLS